MTASRPRARTECRPRPARPWSPIFGSAAAVAGWWLVAHSSGQGWVQALGDLVFAALLVGLVGPALALWRTRLTIESAPGDAQAGQPVNLVVTVKGRARVRPVDPDGPEQAIGPGRSELCFVPLWRGVHPSVTADVASSAPFGLQWWTRRITLPLPEPLHVAPRVGTPSVPEEASPDPSTEAGGRRRTGPAGDLRAPRPYRPGDQRSRVHWPASAHAGELMVRETEAPIGPPVVLTVDQPPDRLSAERAAEDALATVLALLAADRPVVMVTKEGGGTREGPVATAREAGRRLARA